MSMGTRYRGGFYSVNNVLYDVQIWQEGFAGTMASVGFCSAPLEIDWKETDKLEPVQSSSATLTLYSDTDRQFIDLYTIKTGNVRMDVYRNKVLYWSGTLDPELYEEPFSYKDGYGVTLTFSDMAILERLKWNTIGFISMRELIERCVLLSSVKYISIKEYISTKISQYDTSQLTTSVCVNQGNFYDEDGEPMSCREVLDETLRAFGLHLKQRAGSIILYDLNGIYTLTPKTIEWQGNDAMLGVDKVYNNVKITFSPYEKTTLLKGEIDPKTVEGQARTTWVNCDAAEDEKGFRTILSDTAKGMEKHPSAKYFRIEPIFSGEEETGIAWTVRTTRRGGDYVNYVQRPTSSVGAMLMKIPDKVYLSDCGYTNRVNYKLKINISLLFDVRYNPFEETGLHNEEGDWDRLKNWCNFAYIPFMLTLRDADGVALYHWENKKVKGSNSFVHSSGNCKWVAGEGAWGDAWLCWYNGNRKNETGLGGWQTNKQIIGYYRGEKLPFLFDKMDKAEYIDLPTTSGWLELQIGTGTQCYDYGTDNMWALRDDIFDRTRWILYKDPSIGLVDKNGKAIDNKDVEHNAWINPDAKEDLTIDTVLGTLKEGSPTALGQLYKVSDKSIISRFYRGEVSDQLERLLAGTVYSNYADRHGTLSGTASVTPGFEVFTDKSEPGKYILLSETQHLREEESEIKIVQFSADNYKGVKFDENI